MGGPYSGRDGAIAKTRADQRRYGGSDNSREILWLFQMDNRREEGRANLLATPRQIEVITVNCLA